MKGIAPHSYLSASKMASTSLVRSAFCGADDLYGSSALPAVPAPNADPLDEAPPNAPVVEPKADAVGVAELLPKAEPKVEAFAAGAGAVVEPNAEVGCDAGAPNAEVEPNALLGVED